MPERKSHDELVKDWCKDWAGILPAPELIDVYERALDALWRRANLSLGEVTLMAIVDRVVHQGLERFAHLAALKVELSGVHCGELRLNAPALDAARLEESLQGLVVELLRVLGTLTGEVLTPGLHEELCKVRPGVEDRGPGAAAAHPGHRADVQPADGAGQPVQALPGGHEQLQGLRKRGRRK